MAKDRIERISGVCPLVYAANRPERVIILQELQYKELTGKLAGMWGFGYETVEPGENHADAIKRYFQEEVKITRGHVDIGDDLEQSKLCIIRISSPELAAWVHVYPVPATPDLSFTRGTFIHEIDQPRWIDCRQILAIEHSANRILFRAGTYEIAKHHLSTSDQLNREIGIYDKPVNLPPWQVYRLIERGLSQTEALYQLGIDPQPLLNSHALVHSL